MTPTAGPASPHGGAVRAETALRYLLLTAAVVGVVGVAGHWLAWPLITSTVGPTAYMFVAHPETEASRFKTP